MSVRAAVVGGLCLALFALGGCTVQTGSGVNDASSTGAPARTKANPKKASPSRTPSSTDPSRPSRTPATPTRK